MHLFSTSLLTLAGCILLAGCGSRKDREAAGQGPSDPSAESPPQPGLKADELRSQLLASRMDAAAARLQAGAPDEAAALLVSALEIDPASPEPLRRLHSLLMTTQWVTPVAHWQFPFTVEHLTLRGDSLWISLTDGDFNTALRWDLSEQTIASLLFPSRAQSTSLFLVSPQRKSLILQRGNTLLLCDAATLKPICPLDTLPADLTPSTSIVFSPNDLLFAHPTIERGQWLWHIRDGATGQILRSSAPASPSAPPLSSHLSLQALRLLQADGSVTEIPLSPAEEIRTFPAAEPRRFLQGRIHEQGTVALALEDLGAHEPPSLTAYTLPPDQGGPLPSPGSLVHREQDPWDLFPNLWNGLLRHQPLAPIAVERHILRTPNAAPVLLEDPLTAVSFHGPLAAVATAKGAVSLYRFHSPTAPPSAEFAAPEVTQESLALLGDFVDALTGKHFEEAGNSFLSLREEDRLERAASCRPEALAASFPGLALETLASSLIRELPFEPAPSSYLPLWQRLAAADSSRSSWSRLLASGQFLGDTRWHQDLLQAVELRQSPDAPLPDGDDSPWLAQMRIERTFREGDAADILAAIESCGGSGPAAATALAHALEATQAEFLRACLASARDLPPFLAMLARTKLFLLQQRVAEAIALWPSSTPDLAAVRSQEDWSGWEQADFSTAIAEVDASIRHQLSQLALPADPSAADRAELVQRLLSAQTLATFGKPLTANACLEASLLLSTFPEETEATFQLANHARMLGAAPEPCLRAEALALTTLEDYANAHARWIELLTEHPVTAHEAGDYAEAAYTAFETGKPSQAMEILATGIRRFPFNAAFALRAGWIALITGNPERSYEFLQAGYQLGYPSDKRPYAAALLAISAAQSGYGLEALHFYQTLLSLDPSWANPDNEATADWPEELRATLRYLSQ